MQTSFHAMAVLRVQPRAHATLMARFHVSCLLLGCLASLGQGRWQRPFILASTPAQRSTGTFCSSFAAGLPGRHPCIPEPPVRGSRLVWLPCLALLGTLNSSRRGVPCFVQERLRGTPTPRKTKGGGKSKANDPRILTSKIKKAETAAEVLRLLDSAVDTSMFNHIHASAACTSLVAFNGKGKLQAADAKSAVIRRLASRIDGLIKANEVGPRELANVLWAFAKMFVAIPAVLVIMPALVRGVAAKAKGMNARDLANSLWAAAQLQDACPEVLEMVPALVAQVRSKAGDMKPQELSNIILAAAKLQDVAPAVLGSLPAIAAEFPGKAGDMIPQHLSNSLWATAKLQDAAPAVLSVVSALVEEIPNKVGDMNPQNLSNILWAAANLHNKDADILKVVGVVVQQVMQNPGGMNPQELANSLWATAKLQDAAPEVLQVVPAVVAQIPAKVAEMNAQEVSSCLFAAMRLADAVPEVIEVAPALVKEVPGKMDAMKPQGLGNSLEALVVLAERLPIVGLPRIAAAAAAMQLKRILPAVKGKDFVFDVPIVLWACAKLEVCDSQLLAAVAERFPSKSIKSLPPRSLCALAWTYRNLDEKGVYSDVLNCLESEISKRGLREEEVLAQGR